METSDMNVYEIGYHLVPTLPEEGLSAEADKIKALVTSEGGEIISEGSPEPLVLAYPISKTVKAIKTNYAKAYFGWVKATLAPESVLKVKTALDASEVVIRYLIVSTIKESTLVADKEKRAPRSEASADKEGQEEIDKTIDELVIN
jgi:ribosomal protein S6